VIAFDGEHRLPIPVERRVLHSVEIRRDEREDLDVVVKRDSVTFVPEIGLIRAVSSLAHIDGLDIRGARGEKLRPRVVIVNAVAKREGVAGTDDARLAGRDAGGEIRVVAEPLRVRSQVLTRAVHIGEIDVREIHPSELAIVRGVKTLRKRRRHEGLAKVIVDAGDPLQRQQQDKRRGDVVEDKSGDATAFGCKARH